MADGAQQTLLATATIAAIRPSAMRWGGWTLTTLVGLFLAMDCTMKLLDMPFVKTAAAGIGFPASLDRTIGVIELICLVLYLIPRTAVLGAILLTGLLGGAIASHLRMGDPLFSHVLFGVYVGVMAWGGLWLRDERLRALTPIRRP
jgi:hypothetical protein